jgi:hypothetical protein
MKMNIKRIIGGAMIGSSIAILLYTGIKTIDKVINQDNDKNNIDKEELIEAIEFGAGIGILFSYLGNNHEIIFTR